jgi:hypothetical protein
VGHYIQFGKTEGTVDEKKQDRHDYVCGLYNFDGFFDIFLLHTRNRK